MKTKLVILLALVCLSSIPSVAGENSGPDAVVVEVLNSPLPHDEDKRWNFLWDTFANKPAETQFGFYTAEKWKENFAIFSKALVQKADCEKLDSVSLEKSARFGAKGFQRQNCLPSCRSISNDVGWDFDLDNYSQMGISGHGRQSAIRSYPNVCLRPESAEASGVLHLHVATQAPFPFTRSSNHFSLMGW